MYRDPQWFTEPAGSLDRRATNESSQLLGCTCGVSGGPGEEVVHRCSLPLPYSGCARSGDEAYGCVVQPTLYVADSSGTSSVAGPHDTSPLVPDLFRIARRLRRFGGPTQIDIAALMLLHRLACAGMTRPSDLAADAGLDLSTVSRHIRALDEAGLVAREPDPDDRRSFRLSLTPKGADLMVEALRRREQSVERALTGWNDDDVNDLHRLLGRLADDLERIDEENR